MADDSTPIAFRPGAATYARSSNDRSDISIATQQHELAQLAQARNLRIVTHYADAVQSGSTEQRPAFQRLIAALKDRSRGWSHLLVIDTSRVARGRFIAQAFKRECARCGVTILYAKMPETDPVSAVILESVFEAMDEVHSMMSREKGLAGMAENVRQGYRAGGRAPIGYRLSYVGTGAMRDGKPVRKSHLEPTSQAQAVRDYLRSRARGVPRELARSRSGVAMSANALIGVEHNALTYAGHTVWSRHRELDRHGNRTGQKYRPRAEWQIHRDTHPALISDSDAEAILHALEISDMSAAVRRGRALASSHFLTGLLQTASGRQWVANGKTYRLRARDGEAGHTVVSRRIDSQVRQQISRDLACDDFVRRYVDEVRERADAGPSLDISREIERLERERKRAAELAIAAEDGGVYSRLAQTRTQEIQALQQQLEQAESGRSLADRMRDPSVEDIRAWLKALPEQELLQDLVTRIELEPGAARCRIEYRQPRR